MRAIGASDWAIQDIVIVEGLIIGLISRGIGALLAYPGRLGPDQRGGDGPFPDYTDLRLLGVRSFTWLGIVIALAAVASFLPAWNASRRDCARCWHTRNRTGVPRGIMVVDDSGKIPRKEYVA